MNGKKAKAIRRRIKTETGVKPSENEGVRVIYRTIKRIAGRNK